jgi:hypothetical protein
VKLVGNVLILNHEEITAGLQLTRVSSGYASSTGLYQISGPVDAMRGTLGQIPVELEDLLDDDEHASFAGALIDGQVQWTSATLHFEVSELQEDWA